MNACLLLAGTESAQAEQGPAVPPLNTVHWQVYTCAGATRDEYLQLPTTNAYTAESCYHNQRLFLHNILYKIPLCQQCV